jgi:ATP-binding cassette subfamily C protein CydD
MRLPGLRAYFVAVTGSGILAALLIVAQASALSQLIAAGVDGRLDRAALVATAVVIALRAAHHAGQGVLAARAAANVKAGLRERLLAAASDRGPGWLAGQRAGELATLVGRGVDALDNYLIGYLPTLVLGVTVPVAVLARLAFGDRTSALVIGLTLPLIPIFAILVGWHTRTRTERQWRLLSRLGGHFLDMLSGMSTLRAFGRARAQVDVVRGMAEKYRGATMATLRVAFLSALVLELVATVSVALVAVPVGLRLLDGTVTLPVALMVLLLAPEAYAPLRAAGAQFHASQEGLAAATDAFAVLEPAGPDAGRAADRPARVSARVPDPGAVELVFDRVSAGYGDVPVLREVSFTVAAGQRVALVGPSGAGKSTVLALLLGFIAPEHGRILAGGVDLSTVDLAAWRERLAWVPQRPHLFAAPVLDNIRLGAPGAPVEAVEAAARAAQAHGFISALPHGYGTVLGERGYGLSSGQRQRLALARAYLRGDASLLLFDEPTARLDSASEAAVLAAAATLARDRTALLVAHRPALVATADRILRVSGGTVREEAAEPAGRPAGTGEPAGTGGPAGTDRPAGAGARLVGVEGSGAA